MDLFSYGIAVGNMPTFRLNRLLTDDTWVKPSH